MDGLISLIVLGVIALALIYSNHRSASGQSASHAAELERILAAMVQTTTSSHQHMSGIYAPADGAGQREIPALETDIARMMNLGDFDESDPTDAFLRPQRAEGQIGEAGDADNAFGIPGLISPTMDVVHGRASG